MRGAIVVLAVALAFPAAAAAGEVTRVGGTITYAGDAVNDRLTVIGEASQYGFDADFDHGGTITDGSGCTMSGGIPVCGTNPDLIVFDLDAGSDHARFDAALDAPPWPVPTEMRGGAGDDELVGGVLADVLHGDEGADTLSPRTGGGTVDGGPDDDRITLVAGPVHVTGGVGKDRVEFTGSDNRTLTLDGAANDPFGSNIDVEDVSTDGGDDIVVGSDGPNTIVTGGGDDTVVGGPGTDVILAGDGNDRIESEDGWFDSQVTCGAGTDTVVVDAPDVVAGDCEIVFREGQDRDDDDVSPPADCNDDNRFIRPGAFDVPRNGVDEDCSGADADADRDGWVAPPDCNDSNAAIRPDAPEVRGNRVDEDCSGADLAFLANRAQVDVRWRARPRFTTIRSLRVRRVPARGRVQVRCRGRGCPFARRTLRVRRGRASAPARLRRARLRRRAVVEVRITAPETMGRVVRYTVRRGRRPSTRRLCLPPGARAPARCG